MSQTRRQFLRTMACTGLGIGALGAYASLVELHNVDWVHTPMILSNGDSVLKGQTLVHITDLHIGPKVSKEYLFSIFKKIQELQPDWVVMTGDFITFVEGFEENLSEHLTVFPKGKKGTFAVLGNHDYSHKHNNPHVADTIVKIAQSRGIRVLRNECEIIGDIQWVGVDDLWSKRINLPRTFSNIDPDRSTIALIHNPDVVDLKNWNRNFLGWILAGHTHGGQCRLPLLRPPILPVRNKRYSSGKIELSRQQTLYINPGLGHNLPVRFLVRPEVTVFT